GGKTAPQFGTDGTSYTLATDFGHKLSKLYPSIVQLKTETSMIRGLKGVKEVAKVTAFDGQKQLKSAVGDLLFTEYGISGNAVFQISSEIPSVQNSSVKIEFLPNFSLEEVEKLLSDKLYILGNNFDDILVGIVNKKIGQAVINSVKERTCLSIAKALKNFNLKVTGTLGFNNAQVTKGGIFTDLIDSTSFESKLQKGLYIVGEVLNIDGECGGYNLTFAFISGILAGKSIKNKIN
ncbi:MAG: aminoacetone oxidase family FAD-binding enzyme, partial [Clostridia bacterium]|nr:aminoacetone oxidase family FAD-binding enzyme [Clostridia bacterium]